MNITIRPFQPADADTLRRMTVDAFQGVTLEQNVEDALGVLNGHDWKWRKARHIDDDIAADPGGIFVAEADGRIVGCITTRIDRAAGKGRIPNLAVGEGLRGQGIGRRLIEHALAYFQVQRLEYAMIETMAHNEIGNHLYPSCGFVEVARQVHFARRIGP